MSVDKHTNRQLRRVIGQEVADVVAFQEARLQIALSILRRGFWGRMRWLVLGR
jgi:hypothetical protein